jgi:DNA repair protein RecO (recombination protein O)
LTGDWQAADASPDATRNQASGVVAAYTQWHLERGLRSLQHIDREPGRALPAPTREGTP